MNQKDQITSLKRPDSRDVLIVHSLFTAICGSFILVSTFKILAEGKSLFQADYSIEKIIFLLAIFLPVLFFYAVASYFLLKPDQAYRAGAAFFDNPNRRIAVLRVSGIGFVLCWVGYFASPRLVLDGIQGYFSLIKPVLLWGCMYFVSQIATIRLGFRDRLSASTLSLSKGLFQSSALVLFLLLLIFALVGYSGVGVSIREDYWYGAGVPVLWVQIALSLLAGVIFSRISTRMQFVKKIPKIDAVIFVLIWISAAYFWGKEPLRSSHFLPDTETNNMYPYSDGATFDQGSQYALIGQGLFNGQYFDRSLYSALLTYFHAMAGQKTEDVMVVQAALFAVFPAILYLLGRQLHGRTLGSALAALILFRGINAIYGSSMIDSAGPKMVLTDFPTAIGISLIILFILKWMNNPGKVVNMVWAGCSIGLTVLLRTHVILLLPFIVIFILLLFRNRKRIWMYGIALLISGMLVSTLPLDIQNQKKGVPIFYMYYSRIQLVLKERYGVSGHSSSPVPEKLKTSLSSGRHRVVILSRDKERVICDSKPCAVANHFFHNLATSVLSLPTTFIWDDFRHTVKEDIPYWQQNWTGGGLGVENYALLWVNLILISLGFGLIWEKSKHSALFLVMIYFVYMVSNSLAFTSGGRYITPADWIVYVFYVTGALQLCGWLLRLAGFDFKLGEDTDTESHFEKTSIVSVRSLISAFLMVFLIGSVVPLADSLFPRRYHQKTADEIVTALDEQGLLAEANLSRVAVSEFLNTPSTRLTSGRLLYPRFYASDEGEYGLDYPYTALNYRRQVFMVIGPMRPGPDGVIFPVENLIPDIHASDVVVIGCENTHYLDAAVIFILSEPKKIFLRSPDLVLDCPLPLP